MTAPLILATSRSLESQREAARIWALAKARRDQNPEPAPFQDALSGIQGRLSIGGAELILSTRNEVPVGFTLFAPREETLEIFYLAVAPNSWGSGVAGALLAEAENYALEISRTTLELWVINVCQRAGFTGTDQLKGDDASGRTERRMVKQLG